MPRYIITYRDLHNNRGVIVVSAKTRRRATGSALSKLFDKGVFEIVKTRTLYNPLHDPYILSTSIELSRLKGGVHSEIECPDIPEAALNRIKQIYEEGI